MRKAIPILALILIVSSAFADEDFALNVERTVFPDNLTLITFVDSTAETISYQTYINAGSRDETRPGATGLAKIFERLMYRGTEKYPDYSRTVSDIAYNSGSLTTEDYTLFWINAPSGDLEPIIELESDRVMNLILTPQAYWEERINAARERNLKIDSSASGYLKQELYRLAFRKHTYRHPVLGWERDLKKSLTFDDASQFKRIFYNPNYCVIVISGKFDQDRTAELVYEHYGSWRPSLPPTRHPKNEPQQKKRKRKNFEWSHDSCCVQVYFGYKAPDLNFDSQDVVALEVAVEILNSAPSTSSRFAYTLDAHFEAKKDPGILEILATARADADVDSIIADIEDRVSNLHKDVAWTEAVRSAANKLRMRFLRQFDTSFGTGRAIGHFYLIEGDYRAMSVYYRMLKEVSPETVESVVSAYLKPENLSIVTLKPAP